MARAFWVTVGLILTGVALGGAIGALCRWLATSAFGVGPPYEFAVLLEAGAKAGAAVR